MKLRVIRDWRVWPDLAFELLTRLGYFRQRVRQSIWPLPPDLRERVTVRWPRTYQWHMTAIWGDQLRDILRRRVNVVIKDLPQPYKGTIQSEFVIDGRAHQVAFNYSDYPDFIDTQSTAQSLVVFKLQFRESGYAESHIVPGGYLPSSSLLYSMLPYLRWFKDQQCSRYEVYGRFSMNYSQGVRGDSLRRLASADRFRFYGGDCVVRYSRYLREVARSLVCVDLPGEGPLCFRLVEYLAIGSCVVALPHGVRLPGDLTDGTHISYCQGGPEKIADHCRMALDEPDRRHAMETASREFFDHYLHRDQLSAYYLSTVLAAAGVM